MQTIETLKNPENNAFDKFIQTQRNERIDDLLYEFPPQFFKSMTLESCDLARKEVKLV